MWPPRQAQKHGHQPGDAWSPDALRGRKEFPPDPPEGAQPACTLGLDVWPPEHETINLFSFKSSSLCQLVMAALGN